MRRTKCELSSVDAVLAQRSRIGVIHEGLSRTSLEVSKGLVDMNIDDLTVLAVNHHLAP